ncbi:MAG: hypothetical protein KF833_16785 [Verrucomicrobiae bacterium]|nr:hypothetical protein [Verrucomicrobiae bacterium]
MLKRDWKREWIRWVAAGVLLVGCVARAATEGAPATGTVEEWLRRARDAQSRGLMKQASEFAGRAIEVGPADPRGYQVRAHLAERMRQYIQAELDFGRVIELLPDDPASYFQRGLVRLRLLNFAGSAADFDRCVVLRPAREPELWQRGIALFYAGRFAEGRRQFESHRTVNPNDVENSAWHFACISRVDGPGVARAQWMPVRGDERVPMAEIQELMSGSGSVEAVLEAVEAVTDGAGRSRAQLYGHLYLSMYYGAHGRREEEARHAVQAAKAGNGLGLMGDIAQVHSDWVAARLSGR